MSKTTPLDTVSEVVKEGSESVEVIEKETVM